MDTPGATPLSLAARGWRVTVVDETGSTNADLLAAAASGAPDRSVLMARHQTAGRGRLDRTWDAPPGANLLASVLLRELPAHLHEVTQRLALAAAAAAEQVAGARVELKWPNDLLIGDAKLAGILAQVGMGADGRPDHVVVGIGMNVQWAPRGAARLGDHIDPFHQLRTMLVAFDDLPPDIHDLYRSRLGTLGRRVKVTLHDGELVGRAVDVGRDGRLAVLDDCAITHHVDTGDVVHLRPG
jgi:BirA family biotin operon repressor/biotin-[acetyl-CoA-carboxylase] ligase